MVWPSTRSSLILSPHSLCPATMAILLFLEHSRNAAATGPLNLLFPLHWLRDLQDSRPQFLHIFAQKPLVSGAFSGFLTGNCNLPTFPALPSSFPVVFSYLIYLLISSLRTLLFIRARSTSQIFDSLLYPYGLEPSRERRHQNNC